MLVAIFRNPETLKNVSWELRFVLLLWLSVACMLPFNLHNEQTFENVVFSDGQLQVQETFFAIIERAGLLYVTYSGREKEASAALLASLYTRSVVNKQQPYVITYIPIYLGTIPPFYLLLNSANKHWINPNPVHQAYVAIPVSISFR
jgi:hypothetical protein